MGHIYTEIRATYIANEDITILWQDMYTCIDGDEDKLIQKALIGWYYGKPDDNTTAFYLNNCSGLIANFVDCEN